MIGNWRAILLTLFVLAGGIAVFAFVESTQSPPAEMMFDNSAHWTETAVLPERHGLSPQAVEIAPPGFPIATSIVASWIVAIAFILFAQLATKKMKRVPAGAQDFMGWLIARLHRFITGTIDPHLAGPTLWFCSTIFLFILSAKWMGLIPRVGPAGENFFESHGETGSGIRMFGADPVLFFAIQLVQALVFVLLTAVFTMLICQLEEQAPATAHGSKN
jgi:F0F1-type ATP synthase membrane subunit a